MRGCATRPGGRRLAAAALVLVPALVACSASTGEDGRDVGPARVGPEPTSTSDGQGSGPPSATRSARLAFAVIGDFGTGDDDQRSVAARMCEWRGSHLFDLVVTTGDNVYPDGDPSLFRDNFLEPYSCLLDDGVRFHAVLGNHDVATDDGRRQLDEAAFGMPARNYVFRLAGVRFVMVNSNRLRLDWLKDGVEAQTGDVYTIVVMHHPVYSPGKHGSTPGLRPELPRLFRAAGVDLVLAGHDHLYSVTDPVAGIRYVVTGGGGAPTYQCRDDWFVDECHGEHHFLYVRSPPAAYGRARSRRWAGPWIASGWNAGTEGSVRPRDAHHVVVGQLRELTHHVGGRGVAVVLEPVAQADQGAGQQDDDEVAQVRRLVRDAHHRSLPPLPRIISGCLAQ